MNIPLVMTIIGPDRTGLVESVASLVAEHGGNWLESRMSHLGGQFAGILRIHIPADKEQALIGALKKVSGLTVVAQADRAASNKPEPSLSLEIVGNDRPGIVRQISHALAKHGVNVEELNTECVSAPMSGEMLFKAHAKVHIPASCDVAQLRRDLEQIAQELMADVSFEALSQR
jgi:glycine cleavage system regulatory protein